MPNNTACTHPDLDNMPEDPRELCDLCLINLHEAVCACDEVNDTAEAGDYCPTCLRDLDQMSEDELALHGCVGDTVGRTCDGIVLDGFATDADRQRCIDHLLHAQASAEAGEVAQEELADEAEEEWHAISRDQSRRGEE